MISYPRSDHKHNYSQLQNFSKVSSSNLPTANNSFHTVSSHDHDCAHAVITDEYSGLVANTPNSPNTQKGCKIRNNSSSVRKGSDSLESQDGDHASTIGSPNSSCSAKPKKSEDFKMKFKTEMCKFWQIDGNCKFKDNVNYYIINSVHLPMEMVTSERKALLRMPTEQESASNFLKLGTALTGKDANSLILFKGKSFI
jgi:hypothetical protein